MSFVNKSTRILLSSSIALLFLSSNTFSQFTGVGTALSDDSPTSWVNQTAISTGGWHSILKSTITYTGNTPSEEIVETTLPDVSAGNWTNYEKYGFNFTAEKIQTVGVETWDTVSGAWVTTGEFTFNWAGDLLSGYVFTGTIMNMNATVTQSFVYDNADNPVSDSAVMAFVIGETTIEMKSAAAFTRGTGYELRISSEWDDDLSAYVQNEKDSTTLTPDGKDDIEYSFTWEDPNWVPGNRIVNSYNIDGTINQTVTQSPEEGDWKDENRDVYAYGGAAGISRELKNRIQVARQKLLLLKGDQILRGNAYNIQGRLSSGKSALQKTSGVFLVK
ncbi:MAG: hypothetical protein HQK83_04110 [Fibrobacteria bacterium]|nr:hypothetical protein [Fibrobacteria bacterium]